jgi:hypothetical protein
MRFGAVFLGMLVAVSASAALAAGGLSGMGANIYSSTFFNFSRVNLKAVPVKAITVGKLRIELQHTRLADLKKVYGGTIRQQGEAYWLCYHKDGGKGQSANSWFISNTLGGYEFIMMVATQAADRAGADCDTAPASFGVPQFGIPGLGASSAQIKAALGAAPSGGRGGFRADEPGADGLGTATNAQYIGYMMSGGRVTGLGVGETSTPPH